MSDDTEDVDLVELSRTVKVVDGIAYVATKYQARGYVRTFQVRACIRDEEREPVQRATQEQLERSRRSTLPAPPEDE